MARNRLQTCGCSGFSGGTRRFGFYGIGHRAQQPPREDGSECYVSADRQYAAPRHLTEEPADEDDREDAGLAERGHGNERPVDARLAGEPSVRTAEESHEKRQERGVDTRYGHGQARQAAEGGREDEKQGAAEVVDHAGP